MKRTKFPARTYSNPESWQYKRVLPYLESILAGKEIDCKQIADKTEVPYHGVLQVFSHYLKYINKK